MTKASLSLSFKREYVSFWGVIPMLFLIMLSCTRGDVSQEEETDSLDQAFLHAISSFESATVDSLAPLIASRAKSDGDHERLVYLYLQLATHHYNQEQFSEAVELLEDRMAYIKATGTPKHIMNALHLLSIHYLRLQDRAKALVTINESLEYIPMVESKQLIAVAYATKASMLRRQDPARSLELDYKALDMLVEIGNIENEATLRLNIGISYLNMGDYDNALKEMYRSRELYREAGLEYRVASSFHTLATVYQNKLELEKAIEYIHEAITINERFDRRNLLGGNYINLGFFYVETNELEAAKRSFETAAELIQETDSNLKMQLARGFANMYYAMGEYDFIEDYLADYRHFAMQLDDISELARAWDLEMVMAEKKGEYERSYAALQNYKTYKDRVHERVWNREVDHLRIGHEVAIETTKNELLKQQLAYHQASAEGRLKMLVFLILIGLGISIVFIAIYYNRRALQALFNKLEKKNRQILSKNIELEHLNREQKQLNTDKGRLVDTIVHDLRNPLFGINGFLDELSEKPDSAFSEWSDLDIEYLYIARRSVSRLKGMINNLLEVQALEKQEKQVFQQVSLKTIIQNIVDSFRPRATEKGIQIGCAVEDIQVNTCPENLSRILENLISNALKFSKSNTRVAIKSDADSDGTWFICVADEGPGFSESDKKRLFHIFGKLSAKPTGGEESTGLGLYAVNMLTERLGGRITLESSPNKGSTFTCRFPMTTQTMEKADQKETHL